MSQGSMLFRAPIIYGVESIIGRATKTLFFIRTTVSL